MICSLFQSICKAQYGWSFQRKTYDCIVYSNVEHLQNMNKMFQEYRVLYNIFRFWKYILTNF